MLHCQVMNLQIHSNTKHFTLKLKPNWIRLQGKVTHLAFYFSSEIFPWAFAHGNDISTVFTENTVISILLTPGQYWSFRSVRSFITERKGPSLLAGRPPKHPLSPSACQSPARTTARQLTGTMGLVQRWDNASLYLWKVEQDVPSVHTEHVMPSGTIITPTEQYGDHHHQHQHHLQLSFILI